VTDEQEKDVKGTIFGVLFMVVICGGFVALIYFDIAPVIGVYPFVGRWVGALMIVALASAVFGVLASLVSEFIDRCKTEGR
jgi:CDP-diglyceride synthetase